jgi:predicted nucleic acid-binding Zn ribbon protein
VRRKDAAPLSSILDAFLESLQIPHVAFLVSLRKRWPEIAGPLVSRNAMPLSLRNGVLTVVVRNHAWAQELRMSIVPMIGRIRETVGERIPVSDIRFTVGALAPVEEEEEAAPRMEPPRTAGPDPEGLSAVADPETRESLRALHRRSSPQKEIPSKS